MSSSRQLRAEHAIEDLLAPRPGGAATIEVLDRLTRVGLAEMEAMDLLAELRERGVVDLRSGCWILAKGSGVRSSNGFTRERSAHPHG